MYLSIRFYDNSEELTGKYEKEATGNNECLSRYEAI